MVGVAADLALGVLGPLVVRTPHGRVPIREARCRAVLVALLIDAGRTVPVPRLATLVWGHDPPPSMRKAVQVYVSRLRRSLAEMPDLQVVTDPDGYRLQCPPELIDLHAFRRLVADARRHGIPSRRAALLREALGLWRGTPFADTGPGGLREWVAPMLEEERLAALEGLFRARLACGEHAEILGPLTSLAGEHPLREQLIGLLMVALYRCDQTAAAAGVFRQLRGRMVRETGLEPGAMLVALHRQILTGTPPDAESLAGATDPIADLFAGSAAFSGSTADLLDQADWHLRGGDHDRALALYYAVRALARDRGDQDATERATDALQQALMPADDGLVKRR
jgi:DNA-binding SARP family transcriptional activator